MYISLVRALPIHQHAPPSLHPASRHCYVPYQSINTLYIQHPVPILRHIELSHNY
jgi:hypothetical protein